MNADGTWARLVARAQADADAAGELDWLVAVDSTAVRVHQHGATARRTGGNAPTVPAGREVVEKDPAARGGHHRMTRRAAVNPGRRNRRTMRSGAPAAG